MSLDIEDGEFMILVRPSGCGKSTALRMIAGLEDITDGELKIGGDVVNDRAPKDRDIAMVFQNYALYPHMSVRDNMGFALRLRGVDKEEINKKVEESARILDLEPHLDRKPSQLSGGQRQRMALARALAVQPRVLLLEEPFGALDATVRKELRAWLRRLHDEVHVTTVFVTHDQEEAMEVAEQIVVLNDGRIEQVGSPQELYERPANEFVMGFVGPVSELSGRSVRPHDVDILREPRDGAAEGMIDRIVHLGFEVRVELTLVNGDRTWVQTTKAEAEELELAEGEIVWLRASDARAVATTLP
jgi:sulfate transport system ATP-binding protein